VLPYSSTASSFISFNSERRYYLDSVEVDVEAVDLCSVAVRQFDELWTTLDGDVHRDLEVVLFLADERVVLQREVEPLVSVHAVPDHRTVCKKKHNFYIELYRPIPRVYDQLYSPKVDIITK